jgi:hypothetical protein
MGLNDFVKKEMRIRWYGKNNGRKRFIKFQRRKAMQRKKFESIKGYKHPLIASGATTIGSACCAPDKIIARIKKLERREDNIFEPILEKLSTIASGATPIGSTGRAPDDDESID